MTEIDTAATATLETVDGVHVVRFVRRLAHPPAEVWRALTEEEHLAAWFPTTIEGERRPGAPLTFSFRDHDLAPFGGEMLACEPPHLLELLWGPDRLRIELAPDGDGTVLTLTDHIDAAEPGKAARDASGWHVCLDQLGHELDHPGDATGRPWTGEGDWDRVFAHYRAVFPAAASSVGPPDGVVDRSA